MTINQSILTIGSHHRFLLFFAASTPVFFVWFVPEAAACAAVHDVARFFLLLRGTVLGFWATRACPPTYPKI
jgi:hypothetical protein